MVRKWLKTFGIALLLVGCSDNGTEQAVPINLPQTGEVQENEHVATQKPRELNDKGRTEAVPPQRVAKEQNKNSTHDITKTKSESLQRQKKPVLAKGLYLTSTAVKSDPKFRHYVQLLNETELNALVIDVKEDNGHITYDSSIPLVNQIGADSKQLVKDLQDRVKTLHDNNIYTIARVVTFKDPFLAKKKPEWAMKRRDGRLYYDEGIPWVDPYKEEVWNYVVNVAKEAARIGFDEIQFDYVRFPSNAKQYDKIVAFDNPKGKTKAENIRDFLAYAKKELEPYNVFVSADVFAIATSDRTDSGIGHHWETLTQVVDYMSPMIYPSHYANNAFGIPVPDANPYLTVRKSLQAALEREKVLKQNGKKVAKIRPWFQDFTATWVKGHIHYGPNEVQAQIKAAKELGINEYLIWSPSDRYSEEAWRK